MPADQIARLTGRNQRTAERWLAGETAPRGETLQLLAEISEVIDEFKRTFPGGDECEGRALAVPDQANGVCPNLGSSGQGA